MTSLAVDRVRLRHGEDLAPFERIEGLGGSHPSEWYDTEQNIIDSLNNCSKTFYIVVKGKRVWIVPALREGRLYLKTDLDKNDPDELLALPRF